MLKNVRWVTVLSMVAAVFFASGCATHRPTVEGDRLQRAVRPAYSIAIQQSDMVVAVSPVRQTMQVGGSIAALLGAGISAVQDSRNADRIHSILTGYDCGAVFRDRLREQLINHSGVPISSISAPGTAAGYHNIGEARAARIEGLRKSDYDLVLDFDLSYGIYGPEGILATRIRGEMINPETGKTLWRNTITRYSVELYADRKWRDPMERLAPNYFSPRFSSAKQAIEQWTTDNGAYLKRSFEKSVNDTIAAVLTDMGVSPSAEGHYVLGVQYLLKRDYQAAEAHLSQACELSPDNVEAAHGLALAMARNHRLEEAVHLAGELIKTHTDYLPLYYNLAWWHAVEMKDPEKARPYYDRAVELGASPGRRLKNTMGLSSSGVGGGQS